MKLVLMDPKGDTSSKQVAKKASMKKPTPKSDNKLVNKDTESSNSSGDLFKYLMKG